MLDIIISEQNHIEETHASNAAHFERRTLCGSHIVMGRGASECITEFVGHIHDGGRVFLVSDENVFDHHGKPILNRLLKHFRVKCHIIRPGEKSKSLTEVEKIYSFLSSNHARRDDLIIALGGGVVGDLAGFAAATYMRGMGLVHVPTSLMAQVDSSLGGKVGINAPGAQGKNLVGSFHQPKLVVIDPNLLKTLPEREVKNGLGEVVKYGFMADPKLVEELLQMEDDASLLDREDLILRCVEAKIRIVEKDEREKGDRRLLNFGHTLGHVIEATGHYETCSHGEAVAMGMELITQYSMEKCITDRKAYNLLLEVLDKLGIRSSVKRVEMEEVLHQLKLDKKNTHQGLNVVLMEDVGRCRIDSIPMAEMEGLLGGLSWAR